MGDGLSALMGRGMLNLGSLQQTTLQQHMAYQQGYAGLSYGTPAYSGATSIYVAPNFGTPYPAPTITDKRSPNEVWLDKRVEEICVSL